MQGKKPVNNLKVSNMLSELEKKLKLVFGNKLRKIILYGSYARNDQNLGSDIDIMVLVDMPQDDIKNYQNQILDIKVDLTTRYGIVLSVIENNYDYFYEWKEFMPFFNNVALEGVEIYGR